MAVTFRASEIVETAVEIERNGEKFYTLCSAKTDNPNVKELCVYLAGEEKKHIERFGNMLKGLEKYQPLESYDGEYELYLKALSDAHVFINKNSAEEVAGEVESDADIFSMAIGFEKDSIIFFEAMKKIVPDKDKPVIDKMVEEERMHIVRLYDVMTKNL